MDLGEILSGAQDALTVRRVFGEPEQRDDVTVIPVARIRGGGGQGGHEARGTGGGFGVVAEPAGVYVIENGAVHWRPAVDVTRLVLGSQLVALVALLVLRSILRARARGRAS